MKNGRPCEDRIILKEFAKLREDAGLPKVVFHSLRHSSTTYKLKLNHGDLKATQGDTGHAEIDMIRQGDSCVELSAVTIASQLRFFKQKSFEHQLIFSD